MPSVSVLTIARGREAHLANVLKGLAMQAELPAEVVIAAMQEAPYEGLPAVPFPVRQVHATRPDGELPLAAARNAAARAARGEVLAFVDVDCIPAPGFVADIARMARPGEGLVMGEVMYLPQGATDEGPDFARFEAVAVRHSDRRAPPEAARAPCDDYRCFWSLNFALHRDDWDRSGGFDERFHGYGGEDTDFGRELAERGIPISWIRGARVYHQHHAHCMPPIHHMASVLRNAELFAGKWGHRTMGHWLLGFQLMGLVGEEEGRLTVLREPDEADFALCRQAPDMPYANTRRVIDRLQRDEIAGQSNRERTEAVERAQSRLTGVAAE